MPATNFEPVIRAAKNWKATKTVVTRGAVRVYDAIGDWWKGRWNEDDERKQKEEAFKKDAQMEKDRGDVPERQKKEEDEKTEDEKKKSDEEPETKPSEFAPSEMDIPSPPPVLVNYPGIDLNSGDNIDAGVEVNSGGVEVNSGGGKLVSEDKPDVPPSSSPCFVDDCFEESSSCFDDFFEESCPSSPRGGGGRLDALLLYIILILFMFSKRVDAARLESIEAVQNTVEVANKRIQQTGTVELFGALQGRLSDGNKKLVMEALSTIGGIAYAMGPPGDNKKQMRECALANLDLWHTAAHLHKMEKLKEKKPTLTDALSQTLQAMYKSGCLNLADIVDDIKTAVKNKVPLVRSSTLTWLTSCLETSNKSVIQKVHKDYVPICMECLQDGTPEVRDAAFSALTAIAKSVGMRPLERSLEKLDDVRRKKLNDMIGCSGSGVPGGGSSGIVQTSGAVSEPTGTSFARKSAASMLSGKKPVQAAPSNKRSTSVKPTTSKKGDGAGQQKSLKTAEPEDVEPSEMSLDEIESRISSLIQGDTISQLKSTAWKERLEAISSLKEQVEGIQELDKSVEILIRLLCAVPGWSDKNVQVQQQTIEVISFIATTATKFPKKCVVLCLLGLSERVADIKTRVQAMKCLTIFSEAVGPGFIFDRLYKIMKEHKHPKVLSEGISWMVSAVEDFGVSYLNLKALIDFCKETGLQSSAAATRNATIKLIGILHKFVGPDIKGFLTDVKPALLSTLDAEYEKNPYEGPAAPKKTVKASDSSAVPAGGADGLPREDISSKLTPTLLKNIESPDWKTRLESIEAVQKILEEANKRIQPTGTGELFGQARVEQIQDLESWIMRYFREDLSKRLLSADFKKQVDGIEMLHRLFRLGMSS